MDETVGEETRPLAMIESAWKRGSRDFGAWFGGKWFYMIEFSLNSALLIASEFMKLNGFMQLFVMICGIGAPVVCAFAWYTVNAGWRQRDDLRVSHSKQKHEFQQKIDLLESTKTNFSMKVRHKGIVASVNPNTDVCDHLILYSNVLITNSGRKSVASDFKLSINYKGIEADIGKYMFLRDTDLGQGVVINKSDQLLEKLLLSPLDNGCSMQGYICGRVPETYRHYDELVSNAKSLDKSETPIMGVTLFDVEARAHGPFWPIQSEFNPDTGPMYYPDGSFGGSV